MKPKNLRHQVFIREMITHGNRQKAYQTAYPTSSPKAAYANACRLLASPDIYAEIKEGRAAINAEILEGRKEQLKQEFFSLQQRRLSLARIIRGEKLFPKVFRVKGKTVVYYTEASPAQVLTAIDMDTKLENAMKAFGFE